MHTQSIRGPGKSGKRIFSLPLLVSAALCVSLIAAAAITLAEVIRYKELELHALQVLSRWQAIDTLTNDVLLKRVSLSDGGASELLREWERQSLGFSLAFARFNDGKRLRPLGEDMVADVRGAAELWGLTERRISAAQTSIREMISSGLGSRVMVNGFLSTFYRLRLEGLLEEREILKIGEIIASLEILDTATEQFGLRLEAVVARVGREADDRIIRVSVLSAVLTPVLGALSVFLILAYRRFRREERRRQKEAARLHRDFLRDFYSRLSDSESTERALRELGVTLPFSRDLRLCFFRYDRPGGARASKAQEGLMELLDRIPGPAREVFPAEDDIAAVLLDASSGDLAQAFVERSLSVAEEDGRTVSVALSDPFDGRDGGAAFDGLTALFPYRYLYGPRAFLTSTSLPPRPAAAYEYPGDCEDFIVKRILEGNLDEARRKIDETIEAASAYTPATVRAVVARLSSALFSAIERLERAVLFTLPSASTDSLAAIVQLDTVSDVKERFALLLAEIETLIAFHQGQKTNAQADRVDVIIADSFADPNLSLELIADRLSFSAGYVGRVYRKLRGKSVADAINDERISVARARLENTNATIETIAAGVGIANPGSFYRLFKERCGLTPSEYRERTRFPSVDPSPPAAS